MPEKNSSSPTKVLPLPLLPPAPILDPAHSLTLQIQLIGLAHSPYCSYLHPCVLPDPTDPADRPSSLTLQPLSSTQYSLLVSIIERALATGF